MSLYNREFLARRHSGVFNRAHHPAEHEKTSSTSEPVPSRGIHTNPDLIGIPEPSPPSRPDPFGPPQDVSPDPDQPLTPSNPAGSGPLSSLPSSIAPPSLSPSVTPLPSSSPSPTLVSSIKVTSSSSFPAAPVQTAILSSPNSVSDTASSATHKGGLSSGAVGAIVTLVILLVAAIVAFVVRKIYIHRREFKRNTWGAGLVPALQTKRNTVYGDEKPSLPPMQQKSVLDVQASPLKASPSFADSPKGLAPPPSLYNPTLQPTSLATPSSPVQPPSPSRTAPKGELAVVVRTFIPSLPDELNITTGEHIRILTVYDDGWALCASMRNEQGVVPLECLQRGGMTTALQLQPQSEFGYGSDKATRRLSSLVPGANGTY